MIRLLLVDDQKMIRERLRQIFQDASDIQVVGTANDGSTAIEQVEYLKPDVVLVDMEMPGVDGIKATEIITKQFPSTKVLVLSSHHSNQYVSKALQAGATGYLLKNTSADELQKSVRFVHQGYAPFGPGVIEQLIPIQTQPEETASITREGASDPVVTEELLRSERATHNGHHHNPLSTAKTEYLETPNPAFRESELRQNLLVPAQRANALPNLTPPKFSWWSYLIAGIIANIVIWSVGLAYILLTKPIYTSQWTVSLPASATSTDVSLPGVGEARSDSDSPFKSDISDPRENYKFIMDSPAVKTMAAKDLRLSNEELPAPSAKILANTTLLQFSIDGPSEEAAYQSALAYISAFDRRIQQLRETEVDQQDNSLKAVYQRAKQKHEEAQEELALFKARTGLGDLSQIQDLNGSIESLRRQKSETEAQLNEATANKRQLISSLQISPQEAVEIVSLKSDPLFQQYLASYREADAGLIQLTTEFSDSHPSVVNQREAFQNAQAKLEAQAALRIGRSVNAQQLSELFVESNVANTERSALLQELIRRQGEERGLSAQAEGLSQQLQQLETRLQTQTQQSSVLIKLQREAQRAEAIYSSTATRLELSNATPSASYPAVSLVVDPTLPKRPSAPKIRIALLGLIVSSFFISLAIFFLIMKNIKLRREFDQIQQNRVLS